MAEEQKSLTWLVAMMMIVIAVFGWGFLAGSYAGAHAPKMSETPVEEVEDLDTLSPRSARRGAITAFVGNALQQLLNLPAVISWHMTNRIWLPILILGLEVAALMGAFVMKKVETAIEQPRTRRR
jgi:hypothetical protein